MLSNPDPKLTFGALNLIGTDAELAANGYRYEALGDDTDWGNPVPVDEKVISWLQDGALIQRKSYDNRQMNIRVRIIGEDSDKLAIGESAFQLEVGKPNLLTWTPPDGQGEPCVFSVVMSNIDQSFTDLDEVREQPSYTYGLKIEAEPFVRSSTLTTVSLPAPTGTQVITLVDDCTSFTNWAAAQGGVPGGTATNASGTSGGGVFSRSSGISAPPGATWHMLLTRSSLSASLATTPYVRIIASTTLITTYGGHPTFSLNGVDAPVAVQEGSAYWFDTTGLGIGTTLTSVAVRSTWGNLSAWSSTPTSIAIYDISRSNVLGTQSTGRQLSRTLPVAGSARSQGSLEVADASDALGETLVYTTPAVAGLATPSLRQYLSLSGTITPDVTTVSGFYSDMSTAHQFDVPVTALESGGHALLARIKGDTGEQTLLGRARSVQGPTELDETSSSATATFASGVWQIVEFGVFSLPTRKMGTDGIVRIVIDAIDSSWLLDEAWLFNLDTGRLTWVQAGVGTPAAGGPSNRVWLDAPTLASPAPAVYLGSDSDRSNSFHAASEMLSFGDHEFVPPSMVITTITTDSTAADLDFAHFAAFHTHVVAP